MSNANQNMFGSGSTVYNNSNTFNSDKDSQKLQLNADTLGCSGQNQKTKDCVGCGVTCNHTNTSPLGALCKSCFHHWRYKNVDYFFSPNFNLIFSFYSQTHHTRRPKWHISMFYKVHNLSVCSLAKYKWFPVLYHSIKFGFIPFIKIIFI